MTVILPQNELLLSSTNTQHEERYINQDFVPDYSSSSIMLSDEFALPLKNTTTITANNNNMKNRFLRAVSDSSDSGILESFLHDLTEYSDDSSVFSEEDSLISSAEDYSQSLDEDEDDDDDDAWKAYRNAIEIDINYGCCDLDCDNDSIVMLQKKRRMTTEESKEGECRMIIPSLNQEEESFSELPADKIISLKK